MTARNTILDHLDAEAGFRRDQEEIPKNVEREVTRDIGKLVAEDVVKGVSSAGAEITTMQEAIQRAETWLNIGGRNYSVDQIDNIERKISTAVQREARNVIRKSPPGTVERIAERYGVEKPPVEGSNYAERDQQFQRLVGYAAEEDLRNRGFRVNIVTW